MSNSFKQYVPYMLGLGAIAIGVGTYFGTRYINERELENQRITYEGRIVTLKNSIDLANKVIEDLREALGHRPQLEIKRENNLGDQGLSGRFVEVFIDGVRKKAYFEIDRSEVEWYVHDTQKRIKEKSREEPE